MNVSSLIEFLRARPIVAVSLALTSLAIGFAHSCRSLGNRPRIELLRNFETTTVTRPTPEVLPIGAKAPAVLPATNRPPTVVILASNVPSGLLSIRVPPDPNAPPTGPYAPSYRLIECILFNAVDTIGSDSPIIALVVSPCYHEGNLIVPVGTEVHGRAQSERGRDRIMSQSRFVLVWQDGRELAVTARVLDRHTDSDGKGWALDDGRLGLQGQIIRSQSLDEIKLFLSTALSGVAQALQRQTTTFLGIQTVPATARNVAANATSQVLNSYAQHVLEVIKRDGLFVFVPGGKRFYLYVEEPLELAKAQIAGSRMRAQNTAEPPQSAAAAATDLGATGITMPRTPNPTLGTLPISPR